MSCSHPNILRGADGVLRCMSCGEAVERETTSPAHDGAPSNKGEGMEKPKRTRKKKAEA